MGTIKVESELSYDILDENPEETVFDQSLNNYLALRKVSWNGKAPRLEIRKWYMNFTGDDTPGKGIAFLSSKGPDQLTHLLLKLGYGDDNTIKEIMDERAQAALNNSSPVGEVVEDMKIEVTEDRDNEKPKQTKFSTKNLLENISVR